jgi:HlyD family secretion protein
MGRMKAFFVLVTAVQLIFLTDCKFNSKKPPVVTERPPEKSIDIFGKITTSNITNVYIDFPAKVEKVHVIEGQKVKLGDQLVTLSIKDYESQIRAKESDLEYARYDLKSSQLELRKNRDSLVPAQSEFDRAFADYESKKDLYKNGYVSMKEMDEAEAVMNTKKQALNDIKIAIEKLETNESDIEIKKMKLRNLENDLANLKDKTNISNFRKNTIISEIKNGVVYDIGYSNGDLIIPSYNFKKILGIMDLDTMIVQADVPEEFVKDIKIGCKAVISPTADNERKYEGKVSRISSMAVKKNNETIISIDINFDKIDDFLLPNYNVDVKVMLDDGQKKITK